ncbi:MAG: site-specific DNA-methyltransferase, partial [Shewanella sp.]
GRSEHDVLYELLLKLGLDLCVPIEQKQLAGCTVFAVGGGVLFACLSAEIARERVSELAQGILAWHEALDPLGDTTCVFNDSAFSDDVAKTNLCAILAQRGISHVRSI